MTYGRLDIAGTLTHKVLVSTRDNQTGAGTHPSWEEDERAWSALDVFAEVLRASRGQPGQVHC